MMSTALFLLLCLTVGNTFAKEPPEVDCIIIHLNYVHCSWKSRSTPPVNYTISGWFVKNQSESKNAELNWFEGNQPTSSLCDDCQTENGIISGCKCPYNPLGKFYPFYTVLKNGNDTFQKTHDLGTKVKLNPPTNLTVKSELDSKLWFYWNQSYSQCVVSDIRYRINNKEWKLCSTGTEEQSFPINWPRNNSKYELQVRSKLGDQCKKSEFWSDWSEPVFWGSSNNTVASSPLGWSSWRPGYFTLFILIAVVAAMFLNRGRLRIIFIPVVPKPALIPHDVEAWLQISKGFKEGFETRYNERGCVVGEYCSESDSERIDSSMSSLISDYSNSVTAQESEDQSCSTSTSTVVISPEK